MKKALFDTTLCCIYHFAINFLSKLRLSETGRIDVRHLDNVRHGLKYLRIIHYLLLIHFPTRSGTSTLYLLILTTFPSPGNRLHFKMLKLIKFPSNLGSYAKVTQRVIGSQNELTSEFKVQEVETIMPPPVEKFTSSSLAAAAPKGQLFVHSGGFGSNNCFVSFVYSLIWQ